MLIVNSCSLPPSGPCSVSLLFGEAHYLFEEVNNNNNNNTHADMPLNNVLYIKI